MFKNLNFFLCRDIIRNKSYIEWSYAGYRSIFQIFLYQTKWVVLLTWHTVMYKLYSCTNLLSSTFLFFSWLDNRLALAWPSETIKHAEVTHFFQGQERFVKILILTGYRFFSIKYLICFTLRPDRKCSK